MNTQSIFEKWGRQKELEIISLINEMPLLMTSKVYDEAFNQPIKKEIEWKDYLKN